MEQVAEITATPIAYVASGAAVVFGLTATEWQVVGVIGGLALATITAGVNWYFKHKHHKHVTNNQSKS